MTAATALSLRISEKDRQLIDRAAEVLLDKRLFVLDAAQFKVFEKALKRALVNHMSGASRSYVVTAEKRIVGYYCLSAGAIQHSAAPGPIKRNMPEPIPLIVMGRLAVDRRVQGRGVGAGLLLDALERTTELSRAAGIWALLNSLSASLEWADNFHFNRRHDQPGQIFDQTEKIVYCFKAWSFRKTGGALCRE
jgi:GNAT superfamily N-acetyltransferase